MSLTEEIEQLTALKNEVTDFLKDKVDEAVKLRANQIHRAIHIALVESETPAYDTRQFLQDVIRDQRVQIEFLYIEAAPDTLPSSGIFPVDSE